MKPRPTKASSDLNQTTIGPALISEKITNVNQRCLQYYYLSEYSFRKLVYIRNKIKCMLLFLSISSTSPLLSRNICQVLVYLLKTRGENYASRNIKTICINKALQPTSNREHSLIVCLLRKTCIPWASCTTFVKSFLQKIKWNNFKRANTSGRAFYLWLVRLNKNLV